MTAKLIKDIHRLSSESRFPDGTAYRSISVDAVRRLSEKFAAAGKAVECLALENGAIPERYVRNMKMLSPGDQAVLLTSRVSIVGLGGLGGTVTEMLARAGVGSLTLIDGDFFEDSNLNRQVLSTQQTLGTSKAGAAESRVGDINPSVAVTAHPVFLTDDNAVRLLEGSDVVVDCLDNMKTRFTLQAAAKTLGIALVTAAIAGATGHLTTVFPEDRGLESIYGDQSQVPAVGAEATLGCLPHAVSLLASAECAEVFKLLLHTGSVLRNRLLLIDLMENIFDIMAL